MKKTSFLFGLFLVALFIQSSFLLLPGQAKEGGTMVDYEKEKEAIRKVIAKETVCYYKQDFQGWKSTYADVPYFRSYGYWEGYPEKVKYFNGFKPLEEVKKKQFEENRTLWQGSHEERANENFRIFPEIAWYTFDQYSYDSDRKLLGKSLETRILEKHNGQWKIVYLGFHYLPAQPAE